MEAANAYADPHFGSPDPASTHFVTASVEEIQLAEELRRSIEQRYLAGSNPSDPYWCVDAD